MTQQRQLKKRLRELKRIRTAVIVGEDTRYTERQVNDAIDVLRNVMGTAEDREVVLKYDLFEWQYLDVLGYTLEKYKILLSDGLTHHNIAKQWGVTAETLKDFMRKKEEKGMTKVAKLTVEQYKEYAGQGLKMKEIAERVGLSDASVYAYKQKWKNEGLLDDVAQTSVYDTDKVKVMVGDLEVKGSYKSSEDIELDRLTKINADLASQHEILKGQHTELQETNRLLAEKINDILKAGQSTDKLEQQLHDAKTAYEHASIKNTELSEQMDDLERKYNELKERHEDLQGIASGYENHEKELHEEIAYLKDELTAERDKHNNDSDLQRHYESVKERHVELKGQHSELQQRYDLLAKVTTPLVTEFVKII